VGGLCGSRREAFCREPAPVAPSFRGVAPGWQSRAASCSTDRPPSVRPRMDLAETRAIVRASADGGVGDWGSTDLAWGPRPTGIGRGWMDLAATGAGGAVQRGATPCPPR
jgi:hypothetical protein